MAIVRDNILCKRVTFIDGLSGSGKSLIAPFISSLPRAELWKINPIYEYILTLLDLNEISHNAASSLLKLYVDIDLYNLSISRNINFKKSDDSSPFYNLQSNEYLERLKITDGDEEVRKVLKNKPSLVLMTHYIVEKTPLIDSIFNDREWNLIVVLRSPATLIRAINNAKWFERYNQDPREFTICERTNGEVHPWYIRKDRLHLYSEVEHIADFVVRYFLAQNQIYSKYKKNYMKIYFEVFEYNPNIYLSELESAFGSSSSITKKLLDKFELPRKSFQSRFNQNKNDLSFIKPLIKDKDLLAKLIKLCIDYEKEICSECK